MNAKDQTVAGPQVVFALYQPHEGKEADLCKILADHVPMLRRLGLATDRPPILVKSRNGTLIEIFEWSTADAAGQAQHEPEVLKVWEAMGQVADLRKLDSLEEIGGMFPHFEPVNL